MFNAMLTNSAAILTDSFNIKFHETQVYQLAFPPTVYELLWRYEYITFKHTVQDHDHKKLGNIVIDNPQVTMRNQLHTQTNFIGLTRGHEMLQTPQSTGGLDIQDAAMIFQNAPSAKSGIIAAAGSIFFDQSTLKMLVD